MAKFLDASHSKLKAYYTDKINTLSQNYDFLTIPEMRSFEIFMGKEKCYLGQIGAIGLWDEFVKLADIKSHTCNQ